MRAAKLLRDADRYADDQPNAAAAEAQAERLLRKVFESWTAARTEVWCRCEASTVPRSECRVDDFWGLVHEPAGRRPHTITGTFLDDPPAGRHRA